MKKLLLMLSLALSLGACKQRDTKHETVEKTSPLPLLTTSDCDIFNPLGTMTTSQQVAWLQANQNEVCIEKYDACRENFHKISLKAFENGVKAYWNTRTVIYTPITLGTIKGLTTETKYAKFISAAGTDEEIKLTVVTNFTTTPTCYSIPLFYSIGRLHALTDSSVLQFTKAIINSQEVIVFYVNGTSYFYDVTLVPV
jgi:hypothetical protein